MKAYRGGPLLTLACLLGVQLSVAAPEGEPPRHWSFQLELTSRYDDNITELSDRDRDRVGDPAFAGRFKIESPDDYVLTPSARAGYSRESASHVETSVRLDARVSRYARNSIKNYETYGLRLSQDLTSAEKYETRLVLRAGTLQDFYLRELTVPQASLDQGRTVRDSARFSSTDYAAAIEQVLVPRRLELELSAKREKRNYDSPFDERDSDLSGYGASLEWNILKDRQVSLQAGYLIESYDADGDIFSTPALEPDLSSDRSTVSAGAAFRWGKNARRGALSISMSRESREFTVSDPADILHFGRDDTLTQASLGLRQSLSESFYLEAGLTREANDSHLGPGAPSSGSDDVTDYTRNVVSLSIGWRF